MRRGTVTITVSMACLACGEGYFMEVITPERPERRWDKRGRLTLPRALTDHDCIGGSATKTGEGT